MKKLFHYHRSKGGVFLVAATLLLFGFSFIPVVRSANGVAPAPVESLPDLEDALKDGKENISGESLSDLEKVISDENQVERGTTSVEEISENVKEVKDLPLAEPQREVPLEEVKPERATDELVESLPEAKIPPPEPTSAAPVAPAPPAVSGPSNQVTNLEFKMEGPVSRIYVSFRSKPNFREVRNANVKQVVYFFDNTETPQRFQRAYDTSEFPSPVSMFTLLQMPQNSPALSKLIVQMREDKPPAVTATDKGLYIDFPPTEKPSEPKLTLAQDDPRIAKEENIYASGKIYSGKEIQRLEIKNSDIQDVLRLIAKTSGYNIVVGDDVSGKVGTISLENVPWDQAFTLVLQMKKLGYIRQGNVIRVASLASLKTEKDEALANDQAMLKVEPLHTLLVPISYAKASELAPRAKSLLTERGTVESDARTNTIIIKDVEKVVNRVQKLFTALDTQPPRVSISAKIVEMLSSYVRDLGIPSFSFTGLGGDPNGLNIDQSLSMSVGGASTTTIRATSLANLNLQFQIGELEDKVKILANPSVSVVANQQATVTQAVSFFIPTSSVAGGAIINTVQQITANLTLDVTPIVSGDGSIFMTVNIKNEIPRGSGTSQTIDTRSVSTQVLVENGDTAVIGGIFNDTVTRTTQGIPVLKDIPILGFLVSRSEDKDTRNEIFVFLNAKILNAEESFKRAF